MMGLRSGLILPFQFRDNKKLLMIGGPEEERELSVYDLRNVVRAAFGIYNFEFRNKKIGFNIPDELFVQYLCQRKDLTNFVIEILQAQDDIVPKDQNLLSFEPSCSSHTAVANKALNSLAIANLLKDNNNLNEGTTVESPNCYSPNSNRHQTPDLHQQQQHLHNHSQQHPQQHQHQQDQRVKTPLNQYTNNSQNSNEQEEPPQKLRCTQTYSVHTPESLTQSIDPMDIMPKWEQEDTGNGGTSGVITNSPETKKVRYFAREQAMQHALQHHQQVQQQQQQQVQHQHFFANYTQQTNSIGGNSMQLNLGHQPTNQTHQQASVLASPPSASADPHILPHPHPSQTPYTPGMMNRFRRRGERMSKDQKELYVKYFEENTCMLTQRRNDAMLEPHWYKLCSMLNSVPQGAVKNVEEWKQTFDAWRYRVFMYTRYNYKLSGAAAQNPKNYKPLTTTDQRAYAMWTSHKGAPNEFDKMDMFGNLEDTQQAE